MPDLKDELHRKLQASRAALLSRLDGLSEHDLRDGKGGADRPLPG